MPLFPHTDLVLVWLCLFLRAGGEVRAAPKDSVSISWQSLSTLRSPDPAPQILSPGYTDLSGQDPLLVRQDTVSR